MHCIAHTTDILGEVPLWHPTEHTLTWIDLFKPAVHRLDLANGDITSFAPSTRIGSAALRRGGGLLLATRRGIELTDAAGQGRVVADPEEGRRINVLNDGRCDRAGRFWVGGMSKTLEAPTARLYRIDPDLSVSVHASDIFITNSLGWSPDDRVMYLADSHRGVIYAYDFDAQHGTLGERRVFAQHAGSGVPDGSCVDADGFLWNAVFDGGRLIRYAPDGRIDRIVDLPVSRPAACTFGGDGLRTLFVTTARLHMTEEQVAEQPWAGGVLALDVGVAGREEPLFGG